MVIVNGLLWLVYCLLVVARLASSASDRPSRDGRSKRAYCFKKREKTVNYTPWLLLLSILPVISIFRQGTYESGDLSLHTTRLMAFWESLSQGEIIPRWAGSLNAGYGYPLFQFIYPLPYYLASFWHWLGFGFINSIKITIALAYILSGWVFYRLAKKHVSDLAAFTGATLYLFAPYHLVDLHFRVAFGEIIAFLLLPLTMLCGYNFIHPQIMTNGKNALSPIKGFFYRCYTNIRMTRKGWLALTGLGFAGLILSHQAIALVSPVLILPYWWIMSNNVPQVKKLWITIEPLLLGLILSAFYWLPVVAEKTYVLANSFAQGVEFQKYWEYLYSRWRYGLLFQGPNGELAFVIGYAQIALVLIAIRKLIKSDFGKQKKLVWLFCFLFFAFCFLLLPFSKLVWDGISILRNFHYTYRLLLPISLFTALIGAFVTETVIKRRKLIFLLVFLTVSSTILNWGNRRNIPQINDVYLRVDLPYATVRGEGLDAGATKWSEVNNLWQKEPAQELIQADENITSYEMVTNLNRQKTLKIKTNQPTLIKLNHLYFPGWTATVNGFTKPILFEQKNHHGMIAFHVPEGESKVEIEFKDTMVRNVAGVISMAGVTIVIWYLLIGIGKPVYTDL